MSRVRRPDEHWQPVRWVRQTTTCDFCWRQIHQAKPGTRTGERGTKAYYQPERRVYECIECHDELTRARIAQTERKA